MRQMRVGSRGPVESGGVRFQSIFRSFSIRWRSVESPGRQAPTSVVVITLGYTTLEAVLLPERPGPIHQEMARSLSLLILFISRLVRVAPS